MPERLPARIVDRMSMAAGYLSAVLIIVAMLVVCYGVALRYVVGASTVWQTELAIYLLMFAAFVGGAYGLRHGDHVRIDLAVNLLPPRGRLAVRFAAGILGTLFTAVVVVIATVLWRESVELGVHSGTAWNPPLAYPHAILPLGMAVVCLQYLTITARLGHALATGARDVEEFAPAEGGRIQ